MTRKFPLIAGLLILWSGTAHAALTVQVSPGTDFSVPNVVDFSPTGFSMGGIRVTAFFSDHTSDAVTWVGDLSTSSGQATGVTKSWFLKESGDTFFNNWQLENNSPSLMTRLLIEGGSLGHTVFDLQGVGRTDVGSVPSGGSDSVTGTDGSQRGFTFQPFDPGIANSNSSVFPGLDVTATYLNRVVLNSDPPVGDLWTTLQIDFGGNAGGLRSGFQLGDIPFFFQADTDLWGATPTQQIGPVPEPGSLALFGGLGLIGAWHYRRSKITRRPARS